MEGMYIGIKINNDEIYRVDCRRSLVQKGIIDLSGKLGFTDIGAANIRQSVELLKSVSQLSFKDTQTKKVFEIEIHQATRNVVIMVTNIENGASRLLLEGEFRAVIDNSWNNVIDTNGDLAIMSVLDITADIIMDLCNLSKDIINIGALFYIKHGGSTTNMRLHMSQVVQLVVENDDYISTITRNENTGLLIYQWFLEGCPLDTTNVTIKPSEPEATE